MTTGDMDRPGDAERPGAVDDAVWTEIVASFHASPADRRGPWPEAENLPPDPGDEVSGPSAAGEPGVARPTRVVRPARPEHPESATPAVTWTGTPAGPRTWQAPEDEDEGYEPPAPPALPALTGAAKAAWLAGLGGPGYLALATLLHWDTPQWAALLCVLGGIIGFGYLVTRLKDHPDDGAIL